LVSTDGRHDTGFNLQHSERVIRSLSSIALVGHGIILIAAFSLKILPLFYFNIVSCLIFVLARIMSVRGRFVFAFYIGLIEVSAHAWFATAVLGYSSGFHIYALALVPMAMTFDRYSIRIRTFIAGLCIVNYVVLAYAGHSVFQKIDGVSIQLFRYGNLLAGAVVLGALSYYFARAVQDAQNDLIGQNIVLESISRTDELTQLPNRRYVLERLAQEVCRMKRTPAEMCICIADIDHFKNINDSFGHDVGDEVLQEVASTVSGILRKQDVVARWGGEEFLVMLPETSLSGGAVAMEKVRAAVESLRLRKYGDRVFVTITIGVAVTDGKVPIESSIVQADAALYRGKDSGRNQVVYQ